MAGGRLTAPYALRVFEWRTAGRAGQGCELPLWPFAIACEAITADAVSY